MSTSDPIGSLFEAKERALTYQPLLLVDITQNDGTVLHLCTHDLTEDLTHVAEAAIPGVHGAGERLPERSFPWINAQGDKIEYLPRITNQDLAATQALSEDGIDITPTVSLKIADPDQEFFTNFELNSTVGFKGATMVLTLILVDVAAYTASGFDGTVGNFKASYSDDTLGVFIGQCNPATEDNDEELVVSAVSKLNMKKILIPKIPIQKRCPWILPQKFRTTDPNGNLVTIDQWTGTLTTADGTSHIPGAQDIDSPFFPCGFDNGLTRGNSIFPDNMEQQDWVLSTDHCRYTKAGCEKLGMYGTDNQGRHTGSFGGFQFDLAANNFMDWRGKSYIEGVQMEGTNNPVIAKYNYYVPFLYGTCWVDCVVLNVLGDPNSTRGEALVCFGEVGNIIQVVVNDVMIPPASFRYTGYYPSQLQTQTDYLNSGDAPYPTTTEVLPDTSTVPISFCWNTTPILVDTVYPHHLRTGGRISVDGVNSDGSHGRNSANGVWAVVVDGNPETSTRLALVGSSGNQNYTGGGTVSTNLPANTATINTKRWNIVNWGGRNGSPTSDAPLNSAGDPYGNYCVIEYVVPSSVAQSNSVPRVRALVDGPVLPVFQGDDPTPADYVRLGSPYNENPVWQILDILIKSNWTYDQIDLSSFVKAAKVCDEMIDYTDQFGTTQQHQRFACSFVLNSQKNAADVLRSLRQSCNAMLIPNVNGKLKILIKRDIASQQPDPIVGSNSSETIESGSPDGGTGYLAYDFTESDILRVGNKTTFKIHQVPIQQAANKIKVSFQDKENAYQQDGLTIVDDYDYTNVGEVQTMLQVDGPNTYDHVQRIVTMMLAEIHKGNPSAQSHGTMQFSFDTTFKAAHLNVGDIVRITFIQRGIEKQLCRVISKQPSGNFEGLRLVVQWHDDIWYSDEFGQGLVQDSGSLGQNNKNRHPFPWMPWQVQPDPKDPMYPPFPDTCWNFKVAQSYQKNADDSQTATIQVTGKMPVNQFASKVRKPIVPPQGSGSAGGGTFPGPNIYYVAMCAKDAAGMYSAPSQHVRIDLPANTDSGGLRVDRVIVDPGVSTLAVFAGTNPDALTFHSEAGASSGGHASVSLSSFKERTWGVPDVMAQYVTVKAKLIWHAGVFGVALTEVTGDGEGGTIKVLGADWDVDQWVDRQCIVMSKPPEVEGDPPGDLPIWQFSVSGNTEDTLTVIPNPETAGVLPGAALVMRMKPEITDTDSATLVITDASWVNSTNDFLSPVDVINVQDNGDGTATIYTGGPHAFDGSRKIYISGVNGAPEVNGRWTTYTVDSDTTFTITVTISTDYIDGGTTAEQVNGMTPGEEVGRMFRVIGGTGVGETGIISANTNTSITLSQPLHRALAEDSVCIIEEPMWRHTAKSNLIKNSDPSAEMTINLPVANVTGESLLVIGITTDGKGLECPEDISPVREIYMIGAGGATFIRDWLCKAIISDNPMAVSEDVMVNHYRVRVNKGEYVQLLDVAIQAKDPPTGADAKFDMLVSKDGGDTWDTIFTEDIVLENGKKGADFDSDRFEIDKLYRDNLIRVDVTQVGATKTGGQVEIDLKGKVFA